MERSRARPLEEGNELVRSTKKVKDSHHGITEDDLSPREEPVHSSHSSSPTRPVSLPSHVSDGLANIGPIQAFTEGASQDNRGVIRTKLNSNSVKGKKEATRARALHLSPSSATSPRDKVITPSVWAASISTLNVDAKGDFRFGAKSSYNDGDHCEREKCENSESSSGGPPSDRHSLGIDEGTAAENSPKISERDGSTHSATKIDGSAILKSEADGKSDIEMDDGNPSSCDTGYGHHTRHQACANALTQSRGQSNPYGCREDDGSFGRTDEGSGANEQMEFDEGSGISPSS